MDLLASQGGEGDSAAADGWLNNKERRSVVSGSHLRIL